MRSIRRSIGFFRFRAGVNAYIEEHRAEVPAWIDGITPEDVEALERSQYFRFYSIHEALSKLDDLPYSFPNLGSNQFAIAPAKSADGHIIHVEHTHMPWANRFQNYEAHLITPGKLDAAGISWFGSPFFLDGLNDKITWSATWNMPNISDVYEEKLNPANSLQYLYEGGWREIKVEYETFRIKGPNGMETLTLPCYYTHHGPIVKFDKEQHRAYAVKLPNYTGRELFHQPLPLHEGAESRGVQSRRRPAPHAALESSLHGSEQHLLGAQRHGRPARRRLRLAQACAGLDQGDGMGAVFPAREVSPIAESALRLHPELQ